jgi:hypothetical protein
MLSRILKKKFSYQKLNIDKPFENIQTKPNFKRKPSPFDNLHISKIKEERKEEWKMAMVFGICAYFYFVP